MKTIYEDRVAPESKEIATLFPRINILAKLKGKSIMNDDIKVCECGCGTEIKKRHYWPYDYPRFIMGHNGKVRSKETNKKLSEALKGRIFSKEHRIKLSKAAKGKKFTEEHRKNIGLSGLGRIPWNKGKKFSEESKLKMSESSKGQIPWNKGKKGIYSKETIKRMSESTKGFKHTEETKLKIKINSMRCRKDDYCDAWSDKEYKKEITTKYCEICGITNMMSLKVCRHYLILHHINQNKKDCKPSNLQTLCRSCHSKLHWYLKNNKEFPENQIKSIRIS